MEIIPVRYETAAMIGNVVASIEKRAEDKGLKFEPHIDSSLPTILYGDDMRLAQVITNLLTNAVKYTVEGRVDLYVSGIRRTNEEVSLSIRVKDTGIGIKEEDLDKLFESFTRLDETRNRNIEGTGLGMAIVTRLLNMMGSKLDVRSEYGKGSEFAFVVEQDIVDASPMGDFRLKAKEAFEKRDNETLLCAPDAKVLAVDDNEMNLKVIKNLLKLNSIVPDMVDSGEKALKKLEENVYNIILLDHMMPRMDGIETLQNAREKNLIPKETTVIALTANAVVGARESYIEAGFDDYLSKPVEIKALEHILTKYLPKEMIKYERNKNTEKTESEQDNEKTVNEKIEDDSVIEFLPGGFEEEVKNPSSDSVKNDPIEMLNSYGIDTTEGMGYCAGDKDFYMEIVSDYSLTAKTRIDEIKDAYDNKDWNLYAIKVHALKSVAKTVGDKEVFEKAKALEAASKSLDTDFVMGNHQQLIDNYDTRTKWIKDNVLQ